MRARTIALGLLLAIPGASAWAGARGAPRLEARALLVEAEDGAEVRVEFQLRNVGSRVLHGCIGRMWGWSFPDSVDPDARSGTRVMTSRDALPFDVKPGKLFRWNETLAYAGPKAWIEAVAFQVDLLPADCKGKLRGRLTSNPVMLVEAGAADAAWPPPAPRGGADR